MNENTKHTPTRDAKECRVMSGVMCVCVCCLRRIVWPIRWNANAHKFFNNSLELAEELVLLLRMRCMHVALCLYVLVYIQLNAGAMCECVDVCAIEETSKEIEGVEAETKARPERKRTVASQPVSSTTTTEKALNAFTLRFNRNIKSERANFMDYYFIDHFSQLINELLGK